MYALDWICLLVILSSLILGAWRGFLYEILSIGGWVAAFVLARLFGDKVGQLLPMGASPEGLRYAAGFALVFVASAFLFGFVASFFRRGVRTLGLRGVDRSFGALFGVVRALLILLVVGFVAQILQMNQQDWWQESHSGPLLTATLQKFRPLLPDNMQTNPALPPLPPDLLPNRSGV